MTTTPTTTTEPTLRQEYTDDYGRRCVEVRIGRWRGVAIRHRQHLHSHAAMTNINGVVSSFGTWNAAQCYLADQVRQRLAR